jgi:hypothetical protein
MNLQSQIRHLLTSLAALGTYLATIIAINPVEVQEINAKSAELIDPLAGFLAIMVAAIVRTLIGCVTDLFRAGVGEPKKPIG